MAFGRGKKSTKETTTASDAVATATAGAATATAGVAGAVTEEVEAVGRSVGDAATAAKTKTKDVAGGFAGGVGDALSTAARAVGGALEKVRAPPPASSAGRAERGGENSRLRSSSIPREARAALPHPPPDRPNLSQGAEATRDALDVNKDGKVDAEDAKAAMEETKRRCVPAGGKCVVM